MSNTTSRRSESAVRQPAHDSRRFDPRSPRSLIVALCATALISGSGCSTTRTIDPRTGPDPKEMEAGDTVTVSLRDGRELGLRFVEWTADHFVGQDKDGTVRTIERQDISRLQVTSISVVRTVLLIGAVTGFVLGILASQLDYGWDGAAGF